MVAPRGKVIFPPKPGVEMERFGKGSADKTVDGFVEFLSSGDRATGEYHCSECGYGVTIFAVLPLCPMCGGTAWEQSTWSPFSRAQERA
jgi:rubrerythrin